MNKTAVYHRADTEYSFPISKNKVKLRLRVDKNDNFDEVNVVYGKKYTYSKSRKTLKMRITRQDDLFSYYEITLSLKDVRLAYIFILKEGTNLYYYSEDGISNTYDYQKSYYNFFQISYINEIDLIKKVSWADNAVFYQIFVDRFRHGDKNIIKNITMRWGDPPTPSSFAGGDLLGITQKLNYLKRLGVNVIYLTPIFTSKTNHKYDIIDYENVDEVFGGNKAFQELIEKAHKLDIKIVLDAVFNHCSDENKIFQDVKTNKEKSSFKDWFLFKDETYEKYETFSFCHYMPKWNTSNPEVQKYLISIGIKWIKEYHIDGWRLDVSDEVSHDFWRSFRKAVKSIDEDIILIGENWHDAHSYLLGDQYDSIMNYSFTKTILDFIAYRKIDGEQAANSLNQILMRNSDPINSMMLNLLDSHDTYRFLTEVKCDNNLFLTGLAILVFYQGMPCIYYGSEIPLEGGYDPDSRRCFPWNKLTENPDYLYHFKKLLGLKKRKDFNSAECQVYHQDKMLILERISKKNVYRLVVPSAAISNMFIKGNIIDSIHYENSTIDDRGYVISCFEVKEK